MKILVVDDDLELSGLITYALRQAGYMVVEAADGQAGLDAFEREEPALVILDHNLPRLSGLEVCRKIRADSKVPVMMLTVRSGEEDQVQALDSGADDYLTKPFSPRELALRVRSVLRRSPTPGGVLPIDVNSGELTVSTASRTVTVAGRPVNLTNREFDLLLFFLTHTDTVFTREDLLRQVWRWDFGDLSTVTVHVKRLRSKLGERHRVQTVWGRGYMWTSDHAAVGRSDAHG